MPKILTEASSSSTERLDVTTNLLNLYSFLKIPFEIAEKKLCELTTYFTLENAYRQNTISLTASENYPSVLIRASAAGRNGSFYHFSPPYNTSAGEWFFPDSGMMQTLSQQLQDTGKELFGCETFDWRPNGGSCAEEAILLAVCNRGDAFVHFAHKDGGHFAVEPLAEKIGIQIYHFPMEERSWLIDVAGLDRLLRDHPNIKLILLDQSFKLRWQPLIAIRNITPENVVISYDCSHDACLIAGGVLPQPLLEGANILHGNVHKTIPGPQKAFISFSKKDHPAFVPTSDWVAPKLQSNCHSEQLCPMLLSFLELKLFSIDYANQIVKNAKALASFLKEEGFVISGESFGYTETHQVHVILGSYENALKCVTEILESIGIRSNNIEIPGTNGKYGLRLGTQAMTRRGMKEKDFKEIAKILAKAILKNGNLVELRYEVEELLQSFPLFPLKFSLDCLVERESGQNFLQEIFV